MTVGILLQDNLQDSNIEKHIVFSSISRVFFTKIILITLMAIKFIRVNNA